MPKKIEDTIIEYVKQTKQTFQEKELTAVDSLIFSQISYFKLNGIVPGLAFWKQPVTIANLLKRENFSHMFGQVRDRQKNEELLAALAASPRFRNIKIKYHIDDVNREEEKQFSAVTFYLDWQTTYVAFRGTDATAVGWKEDFNMAFMPVIPAQREAVVYLERIAKFRLGRIYVGGHSKGGNLAVFAAAMSKPKVQKRIVRIFSHDGPGFLEEFFKNPGYHRIKKRIHKTVPQSSLIGILLEQQEDYRIVRSTESGGMMQHNPFSWVVKNGTFVTEEKLTSKSKHMDRVLHQWILEMDMDERKEVAQALYEFLEADTEIALISKMSLKDMINVISTAIELKPETRNRLLDIVKKIGLLYVKNL